MEAREYWVSPSQFAFLWHECKRCWWLKAVGGVYQPFSLPAIFRKVDVLSKDSLRGMRLDALGIPGEVISTGRKLKSRCFELNGVLMRVYGEDDIEVQLDDGSLGIYDLKLTTPNDETAAKYEFQNNAYKFAIENPEVAKLRKDVTRLGLLCLSPSFLTRPGNLRVAEVQSGEVLHGPPDVPPELWPIEAALIMSASVIEQRVFGPDEVKGVLGAMSEIIAAPKPPESSRTCEYCAFTRKQVELARKLKDEDGLATELAARLAEQKAKDSKE